MYLQILCGYNTPFPGYESLPFFILYTFHSGSAKKGVLFCGYLHTYVIVCLSFVIDLLILLFSTFTVAMKIKEACLITQI